MKKILVTGAGGFIGSHSVDLLLHEGNRVLGVDNFRTGKESNLIEAHKNPNFSFIKADITSPGALNTITQTFSPDAIIHLAALVSVPESFDHPEENYRLNVHATHLVVSAALLADTKRIVFASSAAVYGLPSQSPTFEDELCNPLSPYGKAKLESEKYLLEAAAKNNIVVRCHRYFNVFGPRQDPISPYSGVISRFCEALNQRQTITIYGDGEQTRDFIFVQDVARANCIAATKSGLSSGVANICTGKKVSINQLLNDLSLLTGNPIASTYLSDRTGDIRHSCGSPARAERDLGFSAQLEFRSGLNVLLSLPSR